MRRGVCAFWCCVLACALRAACAVRAFWLLPQSGVEVVCSDSVHRAIGFGCGDVCTVSSPETNGWQAVLLQ